MQSPLNSPWNGSKAHKHECTEERWCDGAPMLHHAIQWKQGEQLCLGFLHVISHLTSSVHHRRLKLTGTSEEPLAQGLKQAHTELPVKALSHSHNRKRFLMFSVSLLCFSLCPLPLSLSLIITKKSLAPSSFIFPPGIYTHWWDSPEPYPGLRILALSACSPRRETLPDLSGPLSDPRQYIHVSPALGNTQLDTALQLTGH